MMKEEKMPNMKCLVSNKRIQKCDHGVSLILAWKKAKRDLSEEYKKLMNSFQ